MMKQMKQNVIWILILVGGSKRRVHKRSLQECIMVVQGQFKINQGRIAPVYGPLCISEMFNIDMFVWCDDWDDVVLVGSWGVKLWWKALRHILISVTEKVLHLLQTLLNLQLAIINCERYMYPCQTNQYFDSLYS